MNDKTIHPNFVSSVLLCVTAVFLAIAFAYRGTPVTAQNVPTAAPVANAPTLIAPPAVDQAAAPAVVEYTLRTVIGQTPAMAYQGVGGTIDGQINPVLLANVGDTVRITVINGDPVLHDLTISEFNVATGEMVEDEQAITVEFTPTTPGDFVYFCSVPGHREIGMFGTLRVSGTAAPSADVAASQPVTNAPVIEPAAADAVSVVRHPADLPAPIGARAPMNHRIDLTTKEVTGVLADGTTFNYFTFDGTVPGPMLRVRVGDTVDLHLYNDPASLFPHSIDLHSVTGPGGGAVYTQTLPGGETSFTFKAINPGLYVYHCATASIPHHISSGMYGLILVEPEGGLPPVDREFYVMQGEIYTEFPFGTAGHQPFSMDHMRHEDADYLVFNGAVGGLTSDENVMRAQVGETVRIYFGVGGPNYTSSFHVIGEIFDRVYDQASLTSEPLTNVQTTLVPTGGAAIVEFRVDVPGRYLLVDHSLSRLERGLLGFLIVEGEPQPDIFDSPMAANTGGH